MTLARRTGGNVALMALDLDGFKSINDTLGHDAGDEVLQQLGRRLLGAVRDCDTVARMGGSEFAVIMPGVGGRDDAEHAVARLTGEAFATPFSVAGREIMVAGSVGIGVYPSDGDDTLALAAADAALYRAKHGGRERRVNHIARPPE